MRTWTYPSGIAMNAPKKYDEHPINRMQEIREDRERYDAAFSEPLQDVRDE